MSPLATIIKRPKIVMAITIILVLAGIWTYITIPKEGDPDIQVPVFYISITLPGISPEDSERLLIKPVETEVRSIEGIKEVTSIATQSHAGIIVEFMPDVNAEVAGDKLREKVDLATPLLPEDADEPIINETNFSLFPVLVVTVSGDIPEISLYQKTKLLREEIENISSVLRADIEGHREEVLEIIINPVTLKSYSLTAEEIFSIISRNNRLITAGSLNSDGGKFIVKIPSVISSASELYKLVIKKDKDAIVTLKDIAEIRRTFKDRESYVRFNGKPSIGISIIKRIGANIIETNQEVRRVIAEVTKDWPKNINIGYTLDESSIIKEMLQSLQSAIITATVLVMIAVIAALGMRSAILIGISIPSSFMISFVLINFLGMTVNMMLLFGMVLTVGMLVDGSIVIVEYADRKMIEGYSKKEAYILSAQRMFWPIASSTATTLAAFIPMLFWPGVSGEFMSYLPITVIIVLNSALFTAIIFLPVLGSLFGKTELADSESLSHMASGDKTNATEMHGISGGYARLISKLINYPITVTLATFIGLGAIFTIYVKYNNGSEFFVETEPTQAIAWVRARGNLSAKEQLELTESVSNIIRQVPGVLSTYTNAGRQQAGSDIGSGVSIDKPKDVIGEIMVELTPYKKRKAGKVILKEIRQKIAEIPGIITEINPREGGPPTGKDIRLQIIAKDLKTAYLVTKKVRNYINAMEGVRDIEDGLPLPEIEWNIRIDKEKAGLFKTDAVTVGQNIQLITEGLKVSTYRPDDSRDEIDIVARFPANVRSITQLDQLTINTPSGAIPLSQLVIREAKAGVDSIIRKNGYKSVDVKANVKEEILPEDKINELKSWLDKEKWPEGVRFKFRGADEEQKAAQDFLGKAMVAALCMMFFILLTQFNSFYQTIITLLTVVMSVSGVLIGMLITGQAFSAIMTGTGVVALAGIVVNNSIVLIDTYNKLRKEGFDQIDAVIRTGTQRLRPVLLTTITTIFGLLPMALQISFDFFNRAVLFGGITSSWWVQLSTAVIFGLAFATILTLIITPVLLAAPYVIKERIAKMTYLKSKAL